MYHSENLPDVKKINKRIVSMSINAKHLSSETHRNLFKQGRKSILFFKKKQIKKFKTIINLRC
jgi:hypothetical protein